MQIHHINTHSATRKILALQFILKEESQIWVFNLVPTTLPWSLNAGVVIPLLPQIQIIGLYVMEWNLKEFSTT